MSQSASNAVDRILSGKPLKFTITVHRGDGTKIEFQSDAPPKVKWNEDFRGLVLLRYIPGGPSYEDHVMMKWEDGMIILTEENPKP